MMLPIFEQILIFLGTILIGFLVGITYDFYWVIRKMLRPSKIGTFIGDIIFWILITIIVFVCLILGNWGDVRAYVYLGIVIGFYLYIKCFSQKMRNYIYKFIKTIIKIVKNLIKIIKKIWKMIICPIKFIFKLIMMPFHIFHLGIKKVSSFFRKIIRKIKNIIKKVLKKFKKKKKEDE